MESKEILEFAEDQRDLIISKLKRQFINKNEASNLLWLNFKWLTTVLTNVELNAIDEIEEEGIKDQHLIVDELEVESQLNYRGKTFYFAYDEDGQCASLYINNEWLGLGTYNFEYNSEMIYLIRSDYWMSM